MAQRRRQRRGSRLDRRSLGLLGTRGVATGLLVVACAGAGVGAYRQLAPSGIVIERANSAADDGEQAEQGHEAESLTEGADQPEGAAPEVTRYIVHVDGAVGAPGVVELEGEDLRVTDAIERAGGLLDDADTTSLNLAEPLVDGVKIHVPHEGEQEGPDMTSSATQWTGTSGTTGAPQGLVNLNTATSEQLETLPGIGEATAAHIIEDREAHGPFASAEDLMRVSGIGEKKFERVKDLVCV